MSNGLFTLKQQADAAGQSAWPNVKVPFVDFLVAAGGGGGGVNGGGGGGGGGFLMGTQAVASGSAITVTIGAGGTLSGSSTPAGNGGNSVFGSVTTVGGGGGGYGAGTSSAGASGGSGGGSAAYGSGSSQFGAAGTAYQGNRGGDASNNGNNQFYSGGGGGAGSDGNIPSYYAATSGSSNGGDGGCGISSHLAGVLTGYSGGGGGYGNTYGYASGGAGGNGSLTPVTNTGGGGAGNSSAGAAGVVIISYPDTFAAPASTTGTPSISTSGAGSFDLNGSRSIRYSGESAFAMAASDFTIELWLYTSSSGTLMVPFDFRTGNGAYPYLFRNTDNKLYYYVNTASQITSTNTMPLNAWNHVAICRSGTSTRMFVNGTQEGSTYTDTNNYLVSPTGPMFFADNTGLYGWNGYATNIRIVKGTALYTANFTPSTVPLTAVTNTSFLLNCNSGALVADYSGNFLTPVATTTTFPWNSSSPFSVAGYKNRVYRWLSSGSVTF